MFEFFHRAKHWLLFIPIGAATLYQYGVQIAYQDNLTAWQVEMQDPDADFDAMMPNMADFDSYFYFFVLLFLISYGTHFLWYWSVGKGLHHYVPEGTALKPQRFKIAMIINVVMLFVGAYFFVEAWGFFGDFFSSLSGDASDEVSMAEEEYLQQILTGVGVMFLLFFFWLIAMVYSCYYVGKTLKSIELGRPARGGEVAGYALLSYLLLIGIWMLQPKVNRLVSTGSMTNAEESSAW